MVQWYLCRLLYNQCLTLVGGGRYIYNLQHCNHIDIDTRKLRIFPKIQEDN